MIVVLLAALINLLVVTSAEAQGDISCTDPALSGAKANTTLQIDGLIAFILTSPPPRITRFRLLGRVQLRCLEKWVLKNMMLPCGVFSLNGHQIKYHSAVNIVSSRPW
jgi:hypothetical protein